MLLKSEIIAGEIYVYEPSFSLIKDEPKLFQLVQEGKEYSKIGFLGGVEREKENPIWENIITGELVNYGPHCFTTIERIKKQFQNLDSVDESRKEHVKKAYLLIEKYESEVNNE